MVVFLGDSRSGNGAVKIRTEMGRFSKYWKVSRNGLKEMRATDPTRPIFSHALPSERFQPKPMGFLKHVSWAISSIPNTLHWLSPPSFPLRQESGSIKKHLIGNYLYVKSEISIRISPNIENSYNPQGCSWWRARADNKICSSLASILEWC